MKRVAEQVRDDANPEDIVANWLLVLNEALGSQDIDRLKEIFRPDSYWRDIAGLRQGIATIGGREEIAAVLLQSATQASASGFSVASDRIAVSTGRIAGEDVIEAMLRFETPMITGTGYVRLQVDDTGNPRAWTLLTAIDTLKGHELETERLKRDGTAYERDWKGPNWAERRAETRAFFDRVPTALVVGGGHAGLTAAAWLKALNIETLVVDRTERIGDSWRQRYHVLKLHSPLDAIDLPFMPFPPTWPKYIPKDKVAAWFETYVESMELDYWRSTTFEGADYDREQGRWDARLRLADGSLRTK